MKNTFLYEMQDKASNLKENMLVYSPLLDDISINLLEDNLNIISKRYNYPLKNKVIDDLTSKKRLIPIYNKDRLHIPTYIPAYLYNIKGNIASLVNLTNYASYNKINNEFNIDTKQLFACLQTGTVLLGCFENWNSITMNQSICKLGASLYTKFIFKILDKMFAINLDPIKSDKLKFVIAKFFLINILEKSNTETINNMAYSCVSNNTSKNTIIAFEEGLPQNIYVRLDDFIYGLSINIDGLHSLTIRTFIDTSIKMYGTSTLFALEFFPMFCHMLFSVAVGAHLNSEYLIESLMGKEIDRFYNEVANVIR